MKDYQNQVNYIIYIFFKKKILGVEGIFQKESQNINSSLTALGDVLAALSSKYYNGIIPYRNSKLVI